MQYLMTQIFLYLAAATGIGWFIGRFTARSRERAAIRELTEWQEKYHALEQYRNRLKKENHGLARAYRKQLKQLAEFRIRLTGMEAKAQTLSLEKSINKVQFTDLSDEIKQRDELIRSYQQRLRDSNSKVKQLLERVATLSAAKRELEQELEDAANEKNLLNTQLINLSEETKQAQQKLIEIVSERESLSSEIEMLDSEKEEQQGRVDLLLAEQESLLDKVAELKRQKEEYEARVNELRSSMEDLTTQIIDIRTERDDYLERLKTISGVLEKIPEQNQGAA